MKFRRVTRKRGGDVTFALIDAVKDNKIEKVKQLLESGADVNQKNRFGMTPLYYASRNGYLEIVKLLLPAGANVNTATTDANYRELTTDNVTSLQMASLNNHLEIVKLLLAAGADVNVVDGDGSAALSMAVYKNNVEIVKLLLDAGADKSIKNRYGKTALNYVKTDEMRELFNPNAENNYSKSLQYMFRDRLSSNARNAVTLEPIQDGENMVDFHGERNLGRYYTKKTYNLLSRKVNPFTRKPILPSNITSYKAGGGYNKRRTKKVSHKNRRFKC